MKAETPISKVCARAFKIPTDAPEGDGTLEWDSTTLVLVEVEGGGKTGLGYTYADACLVPLISGTLASTVRGRDAFDPPGAFAAMRRAFRNLGAEGLCATAISAVDAAI